jgi:transcriptional regulator with XRE-family HTH domain
MNQDWFSTRLAQLRNERSLSARDLSLSLGQSAGYINKIENKKSLPSMDMFFYICQFLEISPKDFFDEKIRQPILYQEAENELKKLNAQQLEHVVSIMKDINSGNTSVKKGSSR